MRLFDWFMSQPKREEPPKEWWEAIRRLEGDMKQLELEWERTYLKVKTGLASLARRQKRDEERGDVEEPHNAGPTESPYTEAVRRGLFGGP